MDFTRRGELPYDDHGRLNVSSGDIFSLTLTLMILKTLYAASYVLRVFNPTLRPRIVWALIDRAEHRIIRILTSLTAMDAYRPMASTRTGTEYSLSFPFIDGNIDRRFFGAPSDVAAGAMESVSGFNGQSESTNDHRAATHMAESDNLTRYGFRHTHRASLSGPPVIPPPITLPPIRLRSSDGTDEFVSVSNMPASISHQSNHSVSDSVYSSTSKEQQDAINRRTSAPSSVQASASSAALPYTQLIPQTPFFTSGSRHSSTRSAAPEDTRFWSVSHSETESLGTDLHYLGLSRTISGSLGSPTSPDSPYTSLVIVPQGKSLGTVNGPPTRMRPLSAPMHVMESSKRHDPPKQSYLPLRPASGKSQHVDTRLPNKPFLQRQQNGAGPTGGLRVPSMTEIAAV
ncbi:hypothetical protein VTN02DRAFT_6351 [Thermoascus thermophilus]